MSPLKSFFYWCLNSQRNPNPEFKWKKWKTVMCLPEWTTVRSGMFWIRKVDQKTLQHGLFCFEDWTFLAEMVI